MQKQTYETGKVRQKTKTMKLALLLRFRILFALFFSYILVVIISVVGDIGTKKCAVETFFACCWDQLKGGVIDINNADAFSLLFLAILYILESPFRKRQEHYEAWQVIDRAASTNVATSYARLQALQDLNEDGIPLKGLDVPGADLEGINLYQANLQGCDFRNALLKGANLRGANLRGADLRGADLSGADLRQAKLHNARIDENTKMDRKWLLTWQILNQYRVNRSLVNVDLSGAGLSQANLRGANLRYANLSGCDLSEADLLRANLVGTNLTGANLTGAKLGQMQKKQIFKGKTNNIDKVKIVTGSRPINALILFLKQMLDSDQS
jgi:BTB/POZ domain-containing protein KCTD9